MLSRRLTQKFEALTDEAQTYLETQMDLLLTMPDQCRNRRAILHLVRGRDTVPVKVLRARPRRIPPVHIADPMAMALRYGLIRHS